MKVQLPKDIASISGKIGNVVFYFRNGKQYARRLNKKTAPPLDSPSSDYRSIIGSLSVLHRE